MDPIADWPAPILDTLGTVHGELTAVEPLHGMSLARVYRVRFDDASVIVKQSPSPREFVFYTRIAPGLREAGVPIPGLEASVSLDGSYWLVIEDVPPPDAWDSGKNLPVDEVAAILARLHHSTRGLQMDFPDAWSATWKDRHTDASLSALRNASPRLRESLEALRQEAAMLEQPWCWISGDASLPNWGLRPDGSLVLFDWEIFRPGVPASDLAPVVTGLGDEDGFRNVAAAYMEAWRQFGDDLPWSAGELARAVAVAKAVTVVHVLAESVSGGARVPDSLIAQLSDTFPPWVDKLAHG